MKRTVDVVAEVARMIREIPNPDKAAAAIVPFVQAHRRGRRLRRRLPLAELAAETDAHLERLRQARTPATAWPSSGDDRRGPR